MCHYIHLTRIEREKIMFFVAKGYSIIKIALGLSRNKSTISHELRRNTVNNFYQLADAQKKYEKCRVVCKPHKRLEDPKLYNLVKDKFLNHQWSSEEISGRLALEYHKKIISYNTIYRAIHVGLFDDQRLSRDNRGVIRKLRHRGKTRHRKGYVERRGKFPIGNNIADRPIGATNRLRRGHWEADTVIGKTVVLV